MSKTFKITIDAEKALRAFRKYPGDFKIYIQNAMEEIGETVESEAKDLCPRRGWPLTPPVIPYETYGTTGNLKRSIHHNVRKWNIVDITAGGEIAPYAFWVHYGTRKMPPRPFIIAAAMDCEKAIVKRIETAIEDTLS